jgi:hypothetical protein
VQPVSPVDRAAAADLSRFCTYGTLQWSKPLETNLKGNGGSGDGSFTYSDGLDLRRTVGRLHGSPASLFHQQAEPVDHERVQLQSPKGTLQTKSTDEIMEPAEL